MVAVTTPPAAAAMLLSDQLFWKAHDAGAVLGGWQEMVPVGALAGAGVKDSTGVLKVPVPVTVKVPATVTTCVASDLVTVSW